MARPEFLNKAFVRRFGRDIVVAFIAGVLVLFVSWLRQSSPGNVVAALATALSQRVQQTVQVIVPGGSSPASAATPPAALPSTSGGAGGGPSAVMGTTASTNVQQSVTVGDLRFDARSCRHAVNGIECDFQVTNLGEETVVQIVTRAGDIDASVAFDSTGVARAVTATRFGGTRGESFLGVQARLVPNVQTPLLVSFEDTRAPEFNAITLGAGFHQTDGSRRTKAVVFRHVRISE